ncbi:STAS domain-containing protein [Streptomyces xanthophaeus]|uniref:STAS domain-containing protein n=1 Tax=Streptomyces xanthophaeus TaxID=67385 RepID=UPI00386FBFBE|nr:STAS domain-containing protein [Streptomyces xanthophaeus]WST59038.1 STAS domain-containing protein [Streptomyces xanthophaeus]
MTTALIDLRTIARDDRGLGVTLSGELDFFTAEQVELRLHELARAGHRNLILDLRCLTFCDSAGIDLFVRLNRRCRASGTRLLLCDVPPPVVKSMRVLGADRDLRLVVT